MPEIKYEITEHIGVISETARGKHDFLERS